MGQKINPHGLRVGVITDWDSRWYAGKSTFGDTLVEDYKIREYLKKQLKESRVPKIEIERTTDRVRINIWTARPAYVVGKGGDNIAKLRTEIEKMTGGKTVNINIAEVKSPDLNAQLVAENIAGQLEGRMSFRRAMKSAISRSMKLGAKGIKTRVSGRLAGAEIARSESYHEGTIPLQTIRADIDYGFAEAHTSYGIIGVKVWIYKGEVLKGDLSEARQKALAEATERKPRQRRERRDDNRGGRQGGGKNFGDNKQGGSRPYGGGNGGGRSFGGGAGGNRGGQGAGGSSGGRSFGGGNGGANAGGKSFGGGNVSGGGNGAQQKTEGGKA
jgi:small subunit ribosomal protein S3